MNSTQNGPTLGISKQIHAEKYRGPNESFYEAMSRLAGVLHDGEEHRTKIKDIFLDQRKNHVPLSYRNLQNLEKMPLNQNILYHALQCICV